MTEHPMPPDPSDTVLEKVDNTAAEYRAAVDELILTMLGETNA